MNDSIKSFKQSNESNEMKVMNEDESIIEMLFTFRNQFTMLQNQLWIGSLDEFEK